VSEYGTLSDHSLGLPGLSGLSAWGDLCIRSGDQRIGPLEVTPAYGTAAVKWNVAVLRLLAVLSSCTWKAERA